ncbi:TetR/AcrR family transcriptional regulator [Streptomyces sp. SID12501]|uniref:TetR/AcrR family transcriptional regulator n=1 Tax=Streptomyces sp. SID12501 TaxID=2706042 RepID=A0A6B3BPE3_9ACTN|nr:TetR/AcrR family transcriptional regulator [Streptomyces sp. SID12501]NEC86178.1 TetR/AcrR family transcriptional regulator [Streptomyces sp. SID12501]
MAPTTQRRDITRDRIVKAAAGLLRDQGPSAVTTRRVAQEAGLQPPALYRLFQDKDELLDAAAERVFAEHVASKQTTAPSDDPVEDLRAGWNTQISFGLANPYVYGLLLDPVRARDAPAQVKGVLILAERVHRIAAAGRLRVSEERAVNLIRSAGVGTVHTLLTQLPEQSDPHLADAAFDAITRAILTDEPAVPTQDPAAVVAAFRTLLPQLPTLSKAEAALLDEWLQR